MSLVHKAFAYITWGDELLVFDEPDFPELGLQVPGGTLDPGEEPAEGVMREAFEETGLSKLELVRSLGTADRTNSDGQRQRRHYFHLAAGERRADTWDHWEMTPNNGVGPILFRLRWIPRKSVPALHARQDEMLHALEP